MSSWKDKVGPASFNGVKFNVENTELGGGRRTVTHEYFKRDIPYVEDLGRKARTFPVEGYVVGSDYLDQKNRLIDALEKSGPGELVHPYYGTRKAIATEFRVRESTDKGGMATFSITFAETEAKAAQPVAVVDATGKVQDSVALVQAGAMTGFLAKYNVLGMPQWAIATGESVITSATALIGAALKPLLADEQDLASLHKQIDSLALQTATLLKSPVDLANSLLSFNASLLSFPLGAAGLKAFLTAYRFSPGQRPPATTSTRAKQQANFDALVALMKQSALIAAASLAPTVSFDSYESAVASRDQINDLIDEQAETADDTTYANLQQLRSDLVKAVPGPDSDLPHLLSVTLSSSVPSLVLAHKLYGSVDLESDLIARNDVRHPGFISGGRTLEVLSNG